LTLKILLEKNAIDYFMKEASLNTNLNNIQYILNKKNEFI